MRNTGLIDIVNNLSLGDYNTRCQALDLEPRYFCVELETDGGSLLLYANSKTNSLSLMVDIDVLKGISEILVIPKEIQLIHLFIMDINDMMNTKKLLNKLEYTDSTLLLTHTGFDYLRMYNNTHMYIIGSKYEYIPYLNFRIVVDKELSVDRVNTLLIDSIYNIPSTIKQCINQIGTIDNIVYLENLPFVYDGSDLYKYISRYISKVDESIANIVKLLDNKSYKTLQVKFIMNSNNLYYKLCENNIKIWSGQETLSERNLLTFLDRYDKVYLLNKNYGLYNDDIDTFYSVINEQELLLNQNYNKNGIYVEFNSH